MKIQEAIEAAEKSGQTCIRRPIGVMRVRILDMSDPANGILSGDTVGPIGGLLPTQAHYELTPDDICALNWSVADGVKLEPAATDDASGKTSAVTDAAMGGAIRSAAVHISQKIAGWDPSDDTENFAMLKAMAEALENVCQAHKLLAPEPAHICNVSSFNTGEPEGVTSDENQQKTGK